MDLPDLAAERVGGAVVWANDEFFAEKENLLKAQKPVFLADKYTDRGKWMDGWETRRRREPGHDSCVVRLGLPGVVRGVVVDTAFFRGNFPQECSLEAAAFTGQPTNAELLASDVEWSAIVPRSTLKGDFGNVFVVGHESRFTHLRLHIHPDGGVARLRVHGEVVAYPRWLGRPGAEVDLAALEHGAKVVRCNDMFFGSRHNLVLPGPSTHMGDGWETRRSRKEAPDWAIVELAAVGELDRVEVDTSHFKGNFPESCAIEGVALRADESIDVVPDRVWQPVLARTKLQAHTRHHYEHELLARGPFSHLRLLIFPDGGIARLRAFGRVTDAGRESVGLRHLRLASTRERSALFRATCGASKWVAAMTALTASTEATADLSALCRASEASFDALAKDDWLEAFRAHPRIGERKAEVATGTRAASWAGGEQAKVESSSDAIKVELAAMNETYEKRFGFLYIVCASGKSAEELIAFAKPRMAHSPEEELAVAAGEQRKITALRLEKLAAWKFYGGSPRSGRSLDESTGRRP